MVGFLWMLALQFAGWVGMQVMSANCRGSRNEVGCLRFDLLRSTTKADTFMSYEVGCSGWRPSLGGWR